MTLVNILCSFGNVLVPLSLDPKWLLKEWENVHLTTNDSHLKAPKKSMNMKQETKWEQEKFYEVQMPLWNYSLGVFKLWIFRSMLSLIPECWKRRKKEETTMVLKNRIR